MKRSQLMDAIVDKKMAAIAKGMGVDAYLREALRYGLHALVDVSTEELHAILEDYKVARSDCHD
jgi:hypothetical protein